MTIFAQHMIRQLIILICFFSPSVLVFSQNMDSLIRSAEEKEGKSQATAFGEIAKYCYDRDYVMKAKEYFSKSLDISKSISDPNGQMNALKGLLRTAYHKEDSLELSMEYAGRLEELSVDYDNKMMQAYVLHHYGRADREDFNLSVNRLQRALKIYEELGKKKSVAIIYNEFR